MAKAFGVGGIFVKARDARSLRLWYSKWLGRRVGAAGVTFMPKAMPRGAVTVLAIFPASTRYFRPSQSAVMLNFLVDDVEAMLKRAADLGGRVVGKIKDYPYGRFAWFMDPDKNKVELWEPPRVAGVGRARSRKRRRTTRGI